MQGRNSTALATFSWIKNDLNARLKWQVNDASAVSEYHLYLSAEGNDWNYEQVIPADSSFFSLALTDTQAVYYKLKCAALNDNTIEGLESDGYGTYRNDRREKVLIVDGFDRTSAQSGSWPHLYHNFAATHGCALQAAHIPFETAANEAITAGSVKLEDYAAVVWILGDESTVDETFNSAEQALVSEYLTQGGQLFVSGSEIGWDLDHKGSAEDKAFYNNYLKAGYVEDDAGAYAVSGETGSFFEGLSIHYDDGTHGVYQEDYPDVVKALNGSSVALNYANGKVAALSYEGTFGSGSAIGRLFYLAFPFETIYNESERIGLISRVAKFFQIITNIKERPALVVHNLALYGNYPNPFNGQTTIRFYTPSAGNVELSIYNMQGRRVSRTGYYFGNQGNQEISIAAGSLASGTYFYRILLKTKGSSRKADGKFILLK